MAALKGSAGSLDQPKSWEEMQRAEAAAKATATPIATATATRGGPNVPPENAALYVPYDGGVIVEAKGGGGDIVPNATNPNSTVDESKENLAKIFNHLRKTVGLNDPKGIEFVWMNNGTDLAGINNYQGASVFHQVIESTDDIRFTIHFYNNNGQLGFQVTQDDAPILIQGLEANRGRTIILLVRQLLQAAATKPGKELMDGSELKQSLDPSLWYLLGLDRNRASEQWDHSPVDFRPIL